MAEKHSSPGWFARYAPIGVSILSLVLAYLSYHSQKETQEESTAERILVHLDAARFANELSATAVTPKGEVGMEVVNIGLRPLFIKRAEMRIRGDILTFYDHDPIPPIDVAKTNEPMKSLGPSEAIRYKLGWDFEKREEVNVLKIEDGSYNVLPIEERVVYLDGGMRNLQMKDVEVQVQTTKKTFVLQHQIVNVSLLAKVHEDRKNTSKQSPDH